MGLFKILTFVGAVLGVLLVIASFYMSAPQAAAAVAVALFAVVAPYCLHGVLYRSRRD